MTEFKTPASLEKRDLDGIYIRVKLGDTWDERCLTDLIWEDVSEWLKEKCMDRRESKVAVLEFMIRVVKHLHERLRVMGDHFDIISRYNVEDIAKATEENHDCGGNEKAD